MSNIYRYQENSIEIFPIDSDSGLPWDAGDAVPEDADFEYYGNDAGGDYLPIANAFDYTNIRKSGSQFFMDFSIDASYTGYDQGVLFITSASFDDIEIYITFVDFTITVGAGVGADYETWDEAAAGIASASYPAYLKVIGIGETTESVSVALFSPTMNGNTFEIDGGNYEIDIAHSSIGIRIDETNSGETKIHSLKMKRTVASAVLPLVQIAGLGGGTTSFYNNFLNCNNVAGRGYQLDANTNKVLAWNNIVILSPNEGVYVNDTPATSILENNSYYQCAIGADYNSRDLSIQNETFVDCTADQANAGSLSLNTPNNQTTALQFAANFISNDITNLAFLQPRHTGALFGANAAPLIAEHTLAYNSISVNAIGAKGAAVPVAGGGAGRAVSLRLGLGM